MNSNLPYGSYVRKGVKVWIDTSTIWYKNSDTGGTTCDSEVYNTSVLEVERRQKNFRTWIRTTPGELGGEVDDLKNERGEQCDRHGCGVE